MGHRVWEWPILVTLLVIAGSASSQEKATAVAGATETVGPSEPAATATEVETAVNGLEGSFDGAFKLQTEDGRNQLRVGAAAHLDARAFFDDSVAPDAFDIRRARLDVQARVHGFMTMRVQAAMEGSPYIRNAWLDLKRSDAVHLRVGQMKVPFSTEWMTLDNQVNFLERPASTPVYPFFDRGLMVWGDLADKRLTYQLGAYTGAGVDVDASRGDIDDHKDIALRLFTQPWRSGDEPAEGLYLVVQGTHGAGSVPTRRFETGGLAAATYESQVWRWQGEQVIASNDRCIDEVSGEIDARTRWGAELLYQRGRVAASFEWLTLRYDDIVLYHDFWVGSRRLQHQPLLERDGDVESIAGWVSVFLTGERKSVSAFGWRQPDPKRAYVPGQGGSGAWELLLRFASTSTSDGLFDALPVAGFTADDLADPGAVPVGAGSSVTAAVLKGAATLNEASLGVNWIVNSNLRIQLGLSTIWAPDFDQGGGGIVSGGNSDLADRTVRGTLVERESSVGLRFIFRI